MEAKIIRLEVEEILWGILPEFGWSDGRTKEAQIRIEAATQAILKLLAYREKQAKKELVQTLNDKIGLLDWTDPTNPKFANGYNKGIKDAIWNINEALKTEGGNITMSKDIDPVKIALEVIDYIRHELVGLEPDELYSQLDDILDNAAEIFSHE